MSDRIGAVRTYIEEEETCRSRMLLAYFGETESTPCGACDVCLRKHPSGLHQYIIDSVGEELERSFLGTTAESYPIEKIIEALPYHPLDTMAAIRYWAGEFSEGLEIDGSHLRRQMP